jgi:hypothetical protein
MSCVVAAESEFNAPDTVLIAAARMAAMTRPVRPGGMTSMMNRGKIASGVGNTSAR